MEITICGPGCANCTKAAQNVEKAVAVAGMDARITKITDFAEMAKLGVLSTPAIIIDGRIRCVGKVPSENEILTWLQE